MQADEILPGVRDFIQSLKLENIKIGLGSASKNSEAILKKINLLDQFDVIIDGNKVSQSKPAPEVFLKGAAALEILPQNCLVFEDAVSGVEAAINAGMRVVGIGESQILHSADLVVTGFQELSLDRLKIFFTAID
jgi:beta-phosphoglucomutase